MKGTYRSRAENGLFPGLLVFESVELSVLELEELAAFDAPEAGADAAGFFAKIDDFTEVETIDREFLTRSRAESAAALFVDVIFDSIDCELVGVEEVDAHLCDAGW